MVLVLVLVFADQENNNTIAQFNPRGARCQPACTLTDFYSLAVHQETENALVTALHHL